MEQDIWQRIKNHPVPSPDLTRDAIRGDARLSDLFNRVLLAASDRETDVLLHNQSRVFKEILGRTLESIWNWASTSWAPPSWQPQLPREIVGDSTVHIAANPITRTTNGQEVPPPLPVPQTRYPVWKRFTAWLLTPKHLLAVLTAIFLSTSAYYKLQVENMKSAIDSYKEAAGAAEELRMQLSQAVASAKSERERLTDEIGSLTLESANLRNGLHERDTRLEGLRAQLSSADSRIKELGEQIKKHQEKQADDVKVMQEQRDTMQVERDKAKQSVASLQAEAKGLREARDVAQNVGAERAGIIRDLQKQLEGLQAANEGLFNRKAELERDRTLLKFAQTYIHNTRQEIRSLFGPTTSTLNKYLKEYEAAESTVMGVGN